MNMSLKVLCFTLLLGILEASPVVIKGSSPHGETIVAISSSEPDIEKYLSVNIPQQDSRSDVIVNDAPLDHSISIVGPNHASVGTGRGFISTSAYNPFVFPLFNMPLNLEGLGLSNIGFPNNWFRSLENFYDPSQGGNGEVKTVTAINDNGHVYGKVNSVTFDNRAKNKQ